MRWCTLQFEYILWNRYSVMDYMEYSAYIQLLDVYPSSFLHLDTSQSLRLIYTLFRALQYPHQYTQELSPDFTEQTWCWRWCFGNWRGKFSNDRNICCCYSCISKRLYDCWRKRNYSCGRISWPANVVNWKYFRMNCNNHRI